ncbi:MAG: tetratricopeptide repeat protein, partial [Nitrososphaeraceae archaeon]
FKPVLLHKGPFGSGNYISVAINVAEPLLNANNSTPFDEALDLRPNDTKILFNKGKYLVDKLGKYEEAITWFDNAIEIDPNFVDALYNKGVALEKLAKSEEAKQYFDKAKEIDPNYNGDFINPSPKPQPLQSPI